MEEPTTALERIIARSDLARLLPEKAKALTRALKETPHADARQEDERRGDQTVAA
jgi:hypothetical protein